MEAKQNLDSCDLQLLNILQENTLLTAEQIAERVALSPSAIGRRIRTLRRIGAISADVAVIADWVAGSRLSALVHVYLERHAPRAGLDALRRHLLEAKEVQFCLEVSGLHDLVVLLVVRDMDEFNAFADTRLAENPVVRRYETSFVKKRLKVSTHLPLSNEDLEY